MLALAKLLVTIIDFSKRLTFNWSNDDGMVVAVALNLRERHKIATKTSLVSLSCKLGAKRVPSRKL